MRRVLHVVLPSALGAAAGLLVMAAWGDLVFAAAVTAGVTLLCLVGTPPTEVDR